MVLCLLNNRGCICRTALQPCISDDAADTGERGIISCIFIIRKLYFRNGSFHGAIHLQTAEGSLHECSKGAICCFSGQDSHDTAHSRSFLLVCPGVLFCQSHTDDSTSGLCLLHLYIFQSSLASSGQNSYSLERPMVCHRLQCRLRIRTVCLIFLCCSSFSCQLQIRILEVQIRYRSFNLTEKSQILCLRHGFSRPVQFLCSRVLNDGILSQPQIRDSGILTVSR